MRTRTAALALVVVTAGVFIFTRTDNAPLSGFRDAPAEPGGGEKFNTALPVIEPGNADLPAVPKPEMVVSDQASRYTIHRQAEGGAVTVDNHTELVWVTDPDAAGIGGKYAWAEAKAACEKLMYAGYGDWVLPEKTEFATIAGDKHSGPAANAYFLNARGNYWTSTPEDGRSGNGAWLVNFADARESKADKAAAESIRCVRAAAFTAKIGAYGAAAPSGKKPGVGDSEQAAAGVEAGSRKEGAGMLLGVPEVSGAAPGPVVGIKPETVAKTVVGAGIAGLNVSAAASVMSAMALKAQALLLGEEAGAAVAAGQLQKAGEIGSAAKATGAKAARAASSAVTMTAISGGLMVADGAYDIYKGITGGRKLKDELAAANSVLENSQDPASQIAALEARDALQKKSDKAKELVVIGGVKTAAGAVQLASLAVAVTVAPYLMVAGAIIYTGAMIYQHREAIVKIILALIEGVKSAFTSTQTDDANNFDVGEEGIFSGESYKAAGERR